MMGNVTFLLTVCGLSALVAGRAANPEGPGMIPSTSATSEVSSQGIASAAVTAPATGASPNKLIALTFDDGPRPYVLFGVKGDHPSPGLLDVLDKNGVKATFFVVGWRLMSPKIWGEPRHEENIGVSCLEAAEEATKRGHELEDHTFSHVEMRGAEKKKGEAWVIGDVDRGAQAIKAVTGQQPRYLRPPDWSISDDARRDLERKGYRLLTISSENPVAMRDINSLDYLCAGRKPVGCPKPSLVDAVLKQVELREKKGITTHILAFHELSTTTAVMPELINDLKARGYRFVTVSEYMKEVGTKSGETAK